MNQATAFWILGQGDGALRTEPAATPAPGQVQIRTLFSGISRGTELLVYQGRIPTSEFARMQAPFQEGDLPGPVKYGYSSVGTIIAGESARLGQRVFCLFPHQDVYCVPAAAAHPLPDAVPAKRAVLAANMETALNALWDAQPLPGDRITIVGAGVLGSLLCSLLTRSLAIDLEVVDIDQTRAAVVLELGGQFRLPKEASLGRDIVFHTSASESGLATSLSLARKEGRIIELSWYGSRDVKLSLGAAFHSQRLRLQSSQVGTISPNKPNWTYQARLGLALKLLEDPRVDSLLGPSVPFEQLPQHFDKLISAQSTVTSEKGGAPSLCVRYPGANSDDSPPEHTAG